MVLDVEYCSTCDEVLQYEACVLLFCPAEVRLVCIELQPWKAKALENCLYYLDVTGRAKPFPPPALKVGSAPEMALQLEHKGLILTWQHLFLHLRETAGKCMQFIATVELTLFRGLCVQWIDDGHHVVVF